MGFLASAPRTGDHDRFADGLREAGYVDGQNVAIDYRFADGHQDLLPQMAQELVAEGATVILAADTAAIRAAKAASSTTPIVMGVSGDPVDSGFVQSLAHPGGNITGLSNLAKDTSAKRLELLLDLIPGSARMAIVINPNNPVTSKQMDEMREAAELHGIELHVVEVTQPQEIDAAFAELYDGGYPVVMVVGDPLLIPQREHVGELITRYRLPSMVPPEIVPFGGLISYSPSIGDLFYRSAAYVAKILRGARPADLPVEQPTRLELQLNAKAADALGLTIPESLLVRADKIIH